MVRSASRGSPGTIAAPPAYRILRARRPQLLCTGLARISRRQGRFDLVHEPVYAASRPVLQPRFPGGAERLRVGYRRRPPWPLAPCSRSWLVPAMSHGPFRPAALLVLGIVVTKGVQPASGGLLVVVVPIIRAIFPGQEQWHSLPLVGEAGHPPAMGRHEWL